MIVYVIRGMTESGDEFTHVCDFKPTDKQIDDYLAKLMPEEYESVGFTNWKLEKCKLFTKSSLSNFAG